MTVEPIQRRKLCQEVLDRLMQRIESREIGPASQLLPARISGNPIYPVIAAHDALGAEKAMRDHLTRASDLYRQANL